MASPQNLLLARRALLAMDAPAVKNVVAQLDLRPQPGLIPTVGVPLRTLQKSGDLDAFARTASAPALKAMFQLLGDDALEVIRVELGDNVDNPTEAELRTAIDAGMARGMSRDSVLAVLVAAVLEEFPAAGACLAILTSDYTLPEVELTEAVSAPTTPKIVDPDVKEARARRKEEQRAKAKKTSAGPATYKKKPAPDRPSPTAPPRATSPVTLPRRDVRLTPKERSEFSTNHPLVGQLVWAEVPFDATDPQRPDDISKERPALVLGVNDTSLLVRALYSEAREGRQLFGAWKRLGMSKPSYIDVAHLTVPQSPRDVRVQGRLSDVEWNDLV